MKNFVDQAAAAVGSATKLALLLGVTKSAVHQWKLPGRQVPIEHCLAIERATGGLVKRGDLRADAHLIWPDVASPATALSSPTRENPNKYRPPVSAGKEVNSHV